MTQYSNTPTLQYSFFYSLFLFALALVPLSASSQQSYGRIDIRCLKSNNVITFKTADTNVSIGYAATRNENPRATIVAQKLVSTNWCAVTLQFAIGQNDTVTLILRGRYRETEPTGEMVPDWVWVDNVSLMDTNGAELCRNGSFEKVQQTLVKLFRDGQPQKWGYKGSGREIKYDPAGACPQDGERCLKVWHSLAATQSFLLRSNLWYTMRAYFRAE